jgi:hypothetical protein
VKAHRNVTLSLPEPLLRKFRVYAATRQTSMTSLAAEAIRQLMDRDEPKTKVRNRFLDRIRNAPDRKLGGNISWTRDDLHER